MRKELEEKLFKKYPDCFKERYLKIKTMETIKKYIEEQG